MFFYNNLNTKMRKLSDYFYDNHFFNKLLLIDNNFQHLGFEKPRRKFFKRL